MIPIKLKLRNFMAYRAAALDFEGIHLAVLTGENGAGKSSLLDAITWTLWGKARAKRDDELIHLGQSEMEVEYTFDLGGNVYRIIRKRDASKRGRSDLAFHIADAGDWRTLTNDNLRLTQHKINELLRLDYDTFINSAFLLQGRADEFTIKTAGQRKEILGDILGLGLYDIYVERAKKRASEKEKEGAGLVARIEQIESELRNESKYRAELAEAQQKAAECHRQLQLTETEMDLLREQHRAINDKQRQLDDLQGRLRQAEADLKEMAESVAAAEATIAHYRGVLERRTEIEAGLESLTVARGRVKDWNERLQASVKLSQRKHELDTAFNQARAEIEADLREVKTQIAMLFPKAASLAAQRHHLAEAETQLSELQALAERREKQQETASTLKEENARLTEQNKQLVGEMNDIKANLTQLEEAGSNCPICRRPLEEVHQAEVLAQFQTEGTLKGDLYRTNQNRLREITTEQDTLKRQIGKADKQLRGLAAAQGKVAQLSQSLAEAETAALDLAQAEAKHLALQQRLDSGAFAVEVIAGLAEVKAELAELGYDDTAHTEAKAEVENLRYFEQEGRVLAEAAERVTEAEKRRAKEQARQQRLLEQTAADRARVTELEAETAALADLSRRLNEASAEVSRLQREDRFARDKVAMVNQQLNYLTEQAKKRGECEEQLQQVREVQSIYRELQTAFGKKGVQALLIESAIPEIENEANDLLQRMTDGRMNLRFETQRETRSGDSTIETLDIRIADEVGTRDYELYSVDGQERVYIRRNGLVHALPIKELWNAQHKSDTVHGYEMQPADYEALCYSDGLAAWLPVSSILRHPAPEGMLKVTFAPGNYSITLTPNHSIFVMTPEGLVTRRADELQLGDFALTPRYIPPHHPQPQVDLVDFISDSFIEHRSLVNKPLQWDNERIWSRLDQAQFRFVENSVVLAEFLGLAVAEASGQKALMIAVGSDRHMAEQVVELTTRLFGTRRTDLGEVSAEMMSRYVENSPGVSAKTPRLQYRPFVGGRLLTHIINNMIGRGAQHKHIPQSIFNAPELAQRAFLQSLIAGDGHVRLRPERSHIEAAITTVSKGLVADVLFLCRQLGIWTHVEKHGPAGFKRGMNQQESYRISISGQANFARLFDQEINMMKYTSTTKYDGIPLPLLGIVHHHGQKRLRRDVLEQRHVCGPRIVPLHSQQQYQRMSFWLRDWNVVEVKKIEGAVATDTHVYDLVVPGNHSFVAGIGPILVHNSGGEAFRVNFAIRIAMSKVLARRAGARLQTLVIDEGFGTQDGPGRERLVEAINAIQHDFEKILVITHIDELKDVFPVQIDVWKNSEGSHIAIR